MRDWESEYTRLSGRIKGYVLSKLGSYGTHDADDLVNEVFVKAMSYPGSVESFDAWLFRIAHNTVVDYLRSKRKVKLVSWEAVVLPDFESDPFAAVADWETGWYINAAIRRLNSRQQLALFLKYEADMGSVEAGPMMGLSDGTFRGLLNRAMVNLREACGTE